MREGQGKVVSLTRHTSNPLRAHADVSLLVSAHAERAYIEPMLYQAGLQHLLDRVFVQMCESRNERLAQLEANLERSRSMPET